MQLMSDLQKLRLQPRATLWAFTQHLFDVWYTWLEIKGSDPAEPASFFQHLLLSMPTEPECPVVHCRRWLVDLIGRDDSPLLRNIDGDDGLLSKMAAYGASLGLVDAAPTLSVLGQPGGGGDDGSQKRKCDECNSFICKRQGGMCICKHNSPFNLSEIKSKGRRDYVQMVRAYNKANPDKSLKVSFKIVKAALEGSGAADGGASATPKADGAKASVNFMGSVSQVLGDEVTDSAALDQWLSQHNGEMTEGIFVMGDLSGDGPLEFEAVEDDGAGTVCGGLQATGEPQQLAGSASSSAKTCAELTSSGSSTTSCPATEAERENAALRAQLDVARARADHQATELATLQARQAEARAAAETPAPSSVEKPNYALDKPTEPGVGELTPKELYNRFKEMTPAMPRLGSVARSAFRRPVFTPKTKPIPEEKDILEGGATDKGKASSAELLARGIAAGEQEKRKLKEKLTTDKAWTVKWLLKLSLQGVKCSSRVGHAIMVALLDYASELPLHRLATLTLLVYAFGGKLRPVVGAVLRWIAAAVYRYAGKHFAKMTTQVRAMVSLAVGRLLTRAIATLTKVAPKASENAPKVDAGSQGGGSGSVQPQQQTPPAVVPQTQPEATRRLPYEPSANDKVVPASLETAPRLLALHGAARLGDSVLMASREISDCDEGLVPALMDDGASSGTSCTRSIVGAIPGTFKASDAGKIGVGSDGATLESHGSYLFALERFGVDGSEKVLRRMKHTPNLPMAMVFSEATENQVHGYGIYWPPSQPRWIESPQGKKLTLHMSGSSLGWLKVRLIDNKEEVAAMIREHAGKEAEIAQMTHLVDNLEKTTVDKLVDVLAGQRLSSLRTTTSFAKWYDESMACMGIDRIELVRAELSRRGVQDIDQRVAKSFEALKSQYTQEQWAQLCAERRKYMGDFHAMDPSAVRTVSMGSVKELRGVALLRRRHCIDGHVSLPVTVKNLRLEGAFDDGRVTLQHVEIFAKQGCGACEAAKMRRRAFTLKVEPEDPTPPQLGKRWTFDVLELRVPSEHTGGVYVYLAVEKVSKMAIGGWMRGYAEEDVTAALNEIRTRVRPTHGEIQILQMDSHPSHKSKHVRDYTAEAQQRLQLSPGYVHEGVGDCENFFLHNVPSANALLVSCPHLGENHFAQAFFYVIAAKNHCVTTSSSPPTSPAMVYHQSDKYIGSGLHVFGAEAKALVHREARDSKFDLHAKPCIYVGPPVDSDSRAHCAVWHKREYVDVDLGCIAVREDTVLEQTRRDHPVTQPFNQVAGKKAVDVGRPSSIYDLCGMQYEPDELPQVHPVVWVRSMTMPNEYFVFLTYHGKLRPGDMASWVHELGATKVHPYPLDLVIGGQEHNLSRKPVKQAVLEAIGNEYCLGVFQQPRCKYHSAVRFNQPGPPVLFDLNHVDGIPDDEGELPAEVMVALNDVAFVAAVFRACGAAGKVAMLEFPASQAANSPFAAKGRELHATIADTSILSAAIQELGLELVHTEQGAAGAKSRKPTTIVTTANGAHALRRTIGTLFVQPGECSGESLVGREDDGTYKSAKSEVYSPEFAMRLTIAFMASMVSVFLPTGELRSEEQTPPATDDLFPVGTRVELWWYKDKAWYRGTVMDTRVRKGPVHGQSLSRREIQVRYDSDDALLWHALCDYSVREVENEENLAVLNLLAERDVNPHDGEVPPSDYFHVMTDSVETTRPLDTHKGEVFTMRRVQLDLEDGSAVNPAVVLAVLDDGNAVQVDVSNAHNWHVPQNEREYDMSPQRDLWRTAKELKMDKYKALDNGRGMFDLVLRSSVDLTQHKIYNTKWVYNIKFKGGGLIFDKLNPRWCVLGGSMDPRLFKCWAEMMRQTSLNIMWGLKAMYYDKLCASAADLSDAFQATTTVDEHGQLKPGMREFFTTQAPGFEKFGPNGEKLVCRQRCFMQGRIDATNGFDARFMEILHKDAHFRSTLWDAKVLLYHNTDKVGSTASLDEIIEHASAIVESGEDASPQQPPRGWALIGQHVDDTINLATGDLDPSKNRIFSFTMGCIATTYACQLTGWHGRKILGFDMALDDQQRTVTITAQGTLDALRARLFSKEHFRANPRHIVTEAVYEAAPGVIPDVGNPERRSYLEKQSLVRTTLGAGIWITQAYPQCASGINAMCVDMANPGDARLGQLRHMFMYLGESPPGKTFGGPHVTGVLHSEGEVAPFTAGRKAGYYHFFSDASINVTGGIGMFAGCCMQQLCLRQHLESPNSHTSEIVAAGTNLNALLPVNGLLQELSIRQGIPTRVYLDSKSSVFVASSDTAPKKSVWLTRRNKVVTEAVIHSEAQPIHIDEVDMVADSCTKYIKHEKWLRHMHYVLNLAGDPPDCHPSDYAKEMPVMARGKTTKKYKK